VIPLRERWAKLGRSGQEWALVVLVALVIASVLGGLTTHESVGWRQTAGFALVMAFYAIFALGLSLEFGYTGLLNLGHVGFMAIGAYTYGILMMDGGRPTGAAPFVGWLFDQTHVFEGRTVWGVLACAFAGLLAAILLLIPFLLAMEAAAKRDPRPGVARRMALRAALALGGAALVWIALRIDAAGRPPFVAGLVLFLLFAGFLATLGGVVLLLRALINLAGSRTALARSRRARALLAGGLALAVGIAVFVSGYPLGEDGAVAMGVLLTIVLGMVHAAVVALLWGLAASKLREDDRAIVTLGFAEILRSVILNEETWTRGAQPIQSFYSPTASVVAASNFFCWNCCNCSL
jgi:ABC-type branched-subunit amino acid transport system permease subunit